MGKMSVAIFASGSGTTFEAILNHSREENCSYTVCCLVTDKRECGASVIAKQNNIMIVDYKNAVMKLKELHPELIVLAGFLKILEPFLLDSFPDRIINIHPSLLPSFGGKGFYGMRVHREVIESGVQYSGFTVHIVRKDIDNGPIIFQQVVPVTAQDTPESLQERVHSLELRYFPLVIDSLAEKGFIIEKGRVKPDFE
ncbi:MAG: phosphoribosylglycinamide formyltransferase [Cuniculiplasma sp.]